MQETENKPQVSEHITSGISVNNGQPCSDLHQTILVNHFVRVKYGFSVKPNFLVCHLI